MESTTIFLDKTYVLDGVKITGAEIQDGILALELLKNTKR